MQLQTDKENRELKAHGRYEFPVFISDELLSRYERGSFSWHWHPEIELTLILEGEIAYQVNEKSYVLKEGEGLFCNTNALHAGRMIDGCDCHYRSITFAPRLLYGFPGSVIQKKYVEPLLTEVRCSSLSFLPEIPWQKRVLEKLSLVSTLSPDTTMTYEMEVQSALLSIWILLYQNVPLSGQQENTQAARDMERLRTLLDYIHRHYPEHITLDDLAAQIHICRSECCRFFRKCMNESLFDYLLDYRIEKSLSLLLNSTDSISSVAWQTGFSSPAYYAKIFRKQLGCSPSEYRRNALARTSEASPEDSSV